METLNFTEWHRGWHPRAWERHLELCETQQAGQSTSADDWHLYLLPDRIVALNSYTAQEAAYVGDDARAVFDRITFGGDREGLIRAMFGA